MAAEPCSLPAGDSATWCRQDTDHPASAGWSLTYYFAKLGSSIVTLDTTGSGSEFKAVMPAATSAGMAAGSWTWNAVATKGAERVTVASGAIEILPDPTLAHDPRSHAKKCLDAVTAALERRVGDPMLEYEIDGIKAKKIPHAELVHLRAIYADKVRRERGGAFFRSYRV